MNDPNKAEWKAAVKELFEEHEQTYNRLQTSWLSQVEQLAGVHFGKMMESQSATEGYLGHSDPFLRKAALFIIQNNWGPSTGIAAALKKIAFEDSDDDNRNIALLLFASVFRGTDDAAVGNAIASVVKNDSFSKDFRITAYLALFEIRGLPTEEMPQTWSPDFDFPKSINWSFVNSF
jgi:hypothetical protein